MEGTGGNEGLGSSGEEGGLAMKSTVVVPKQNSSSSWVSFRCHTADCVIKEKAESGKAKHLPHLWSAYIVQERVNSGTTPPPTHTDKFSLKSPCLPQGCSKRPAS